MCKLGVRGHRPHTGSINAQKFKMALKISSDMLADQQTIFSTLLWKLLS